MLYEAEVVDGNPDASRPGHIKVKIPQLFRDKEFPGLIPPLFPGSPFGGWQSIPTSINPDDNSLPVRVVVIHLGGSAFRWLGTSQWWSEITENAGTRVGVRSPDGRHKITLDSTEGFFVAVESDADEDSSASVAISPSGDSIIMSVRTGVKLEMSPNKMEWTVPQNSGQHKITADNSGVVISAAENNSSLSMTSGGQTDLVGGTVNIIGDNINLKGSVGPATHAYLLSTTFFTDLALVLADLLATGAAIPSMSPYVAANATTMISKITTSMTSGAPYLSSRIKGN